MTTKELIGTKFMGHCPLCGKKTELFCLEITRNLEPISKYLCESCDVMVTVHSKNLEILEIK